MADRWGLPNPWLLPTMLEPQTIRMWEIFFVEQYKEGDTDSGEAEIGEWLESQWE